MLYGIVALVLFLSGLATGFKVDEWKHDAVEAANLRAQVAAQKAEDIRTAKIQETFQKGLASLRLTGKTADKKVANELLQQVYHECVVPDSGRVLNDATATDINHILGLDGSMSSNTAPAAKSAGSAGQIGHGGSVHSASGFDARVRELRAKAEATSAGAERAAESAPKR